MRFTIGLFAGGSFGSRAVYLMLVVWCRVRVELFAVAKWHPLWERVSGRCLARGFVWDDPVSGGEAGELGC